MSLNFADYVRLDIPEGRVKQITRKSDGLVLWKAGYVNQVPLSIDADGTIYNNGLGYKDGYRVRSGGAESVQSYGSVTGYIPLKIGDTLRIWPPFDGGNTHNTINFYDASFTNLGQVTDFGVGYGICSGKYALYKTAVVDGASTLTLTSEHDASIRYVRITNRIGTTEGVAPVVTTGADMIVTINEEIT